MQYEISVVVKIKINITLIFSNKTHGLNTEKILWWKK